MTLGDGLRQWSQVRAGQHGGAHPSGGDVEVELARRGGPLDDPIELVAGGLGVVVAPGLPSGLIASLHRRTVRTSCLGDVGGLRVGRHGSRLGQFRQRRGQQPEGTTDRCAVDPSYHASLSAGSVRSLVRQGGPMSPEEVARFEAHPAHEAAVALRGWDDGGKAVDLHVAELATYRPLLDSLARS